MWPIVVTLLLSTLLFIAFLLNSYLQRKRSFWKSKGIYTFQNEFNLFKILRGHTPFDLDLIHYHELERMGLPYGGSSEFGAPILVVRDLELIKFILVKDFDFFMDRRGFGESDPVFKNSLFSMRGQAWKNMRVALSPTFTSGKLRRMFQQFDISGQKLFNYINEHFPRAKHSIGHDVTLDEILRRYTVDVIGSVAFGIETNALKEKDSDFLKYADKSGTANFARTVRHTFLMCAPKLASLLNIQFVDGESMRFFQSILLSAIKLRDSTGERRNDFLQILLDARNAFRNKVAVASESCKAAAGEDNDEVLPYDFTDEVIFAQAFIFFFSGYEAVTTLLRNLFYFLSAHPEIQDRLRAEVIEQVELVGGKVTYECVSSMEYMEMVMSETLRLCPPLTRTERICNSDYKLPGGEFIPKDTIVCIPVIGIHMDKNIYPNPEEFDPEHFCPKRNSERNPYTYLSFGIGPRHCIAERFALMEAKAAVAHILMKFKIEPSDKYPLPLKWGKQMGVNTSRMDVIVRFIPITQQN